MPGYKRMASSSPQHARRSRRIANLTGNNGVAAPVKNEDNVADTLDETDEDGPSHDTDDDYSSDDEDVENEIDEDGFRAFDKDAEYQKRYIVQDEHTGRVVTIIPHETLRPINGVEYSDYKIHKNTLLYLMDLRANNRRSWFKRHQKEFRRAWKDWETFIETLTPKVIAFDSTIPELPPKDVIFRIYRDVRFSKDKRLYKSHFSAAFSRTGRRRPYACYYIHLDPGSSYVGGGLWAPEPPTIQLLRDSINERPEAWRQILSSEDFRNMFLPGGKAGVEGALEAFAEANKEGALKTKPKGYAIHHRDIELLKLRNYHVVKPVNDAIFTAEDGQDRIISILRILLPFVTFLNDIIMPNSDES
ncbi:hypothetical protein AFLA_002024 [Aspergillus flavus NRRL3357]|nr:uncharacterized protein G4B84_006156 [Aspergillus flavus NRRL3357]KAF7625150.1 hypothetical protein AFLA_002024 [Aspergillus flavus NRRL3357]QMW30775.1 hypothetical protein G4B84_006156 [Aspergillus flavus NRRL3357]QMW42828.1 hypothetical protein G4B11_006198 [Aspergillus flavus]RAQ51853.1 hypothetical protein AFGD_006057 [Aspergillus flavus]